MRNSYGYDSYRGRSKLRTALTVLIVILLVVLLLAVAAFFLLQKYMVYTDDGQARLDLPFLQGEAVNARDPAPAASQDIVVVTAQPSATPEPTPPPSAVAAVRPVSLFRANLTQGSAVQAVSAAGGDAALLNMKANDGTLGYASAVPLALSSGASAKEAGLNEQLRAVTGSDLYTIARVSCFKDNKAPRNEPTLGVKTANNYNWRDGEDTRWLDPSLPAARQYVADLCVELADLGFDEILLDNAGWPLTGDVSGIRSPGYAPETLSGTVETFYQEVRKALEGKNVLLSVAVDAGSLLGTDPLSGQSAALAGQYADRVYVLGAEQEGNCDAALAQAGLSGGAVVYVDPDLPDLSTSGGSILYPQE